MILEVIASLLLSSLHIIYGYHNSGCVYMLGTALGLSHLIVNINRVACLCWLRVGGLSFPLHVIKCSVHVIVCVPQKAKGPEKQTSHDWFDMQLQLVGV